MARRRGGLVGRAMDVAQDYLGVAVISTQQLDGIRNELSEAIEDVGTLRRDASRQLYTDLNYVGGTTRHELTPRARLDIVHKARVAWSEDPQAGAVVDLKNAFVFGRGVPTPRAADQEVQEVLDLTWKDPANRRILTSHSKLVEKGVDMALQSNVFLLYFDDGADGRVRMSMAEHDTIVDAVRDPDNRYRILYYKAIRREVEWDWTKGTYVLARAADGSTRERAVYYEVIDAFADPTDLDAVNVDDLDSRAMMPPEQRGSLMPGKILHLAVNKESEALFGVPRFKRMLRWFHAYEQIMRTSVDLMKAAASVYMKADVRGGRKQVERASAQQVRRSSPLTQLAIGEFSMGDMVPTPPATGPSVIYENPGINYQPFKIDAHANEIATIAGQARMQIAANTFPMHYLGDQSQTNLATSASVELPVLKIIEEEQEVWEVGFRTLADLAIKRALETGLISEWREVSDDERERMAPTTKTDPITGEETTTPGQELDDYDAERDMMLRDLTYEFNMPNPLKRMMGDIVAAVSTVADAFDPTGQNVELSRLLLGIVLEQAFEVHDPGKLVDQVFPDDFEPPQKQPPTVVHVGPDGRPVAPPAPAPGSRGAVAPPGAPGQNGQRHTAQNPYGAFRRSAEPRSVAEGDVVSPDEMREILEAAADRAMRRGLRPRPDDETFQRVHEEFRRETRENLAELVAAVRGGGGGE